MKDKGQASNYKKRNDWDYLGDVIVMFMGFHLTLYMAHVFSTRHTKTMQN
jgi:hypothetical protein